VNVMKTRIGIAVLAAVCVGLLVALVITHRQTVDERKKDVDTILDFSNQWTIANSSLDELRQVNLMLTNDLETSRKAMLDFSNQFTEASDTLSNTEAAFQTAEEQITNLNSHITDLENQNRELDQRATELADTISNLTGQISVTEQKLAESETNNVFLAQELKRQLSEKAELERKFNTLSVVRAQVKKLREELAIARRVEWMREGVYDSPKGAQLLMARPPAPNAPPRPPHYDLNVEVGSDGSVHIIPALTNAPAVTNSP
jgi:hypothetical protein